VGIADPTLQPLFVNDFGRRMTGLPDAADLATLSIPDFFASDDRAAVRDVVLPTLLREGAWEGEYRFHHFGGGDGAMVKWSAFLLREADGEVLGAGWLTTDLTHRLEAEARLRESRARLKAAGDLVGLSSYLWNPRTGALQWDQRLKDLWGVPPGVEPDHALWMQGVHPDDRERVEAAADRAIDPDGDGAYAIEYRVIGLNGEAERWVRTCGETQFEGRAPAAFIGAVLDITHQKLAEAQLRRSEAYLAAILRQLPVGVSVFDTKGHQVLGNAAAERFQLRDMPSRDPASTKLWQGFREDGGPLPASDYPGERALRGETGTPGTNFLYTLADGAQLWARVSAAPLREDNGAIQGVVWIIEDVDEQHRNEVRRQESEERFRRFAENSSDVLWIFNPDEKRLEYLSPGFQPTWGVPPEAALADVDVWNDLVHPDDRPARADTFNRVIVDGEPITHEYRIMRPDGSVRWIRDTTFPIRNADGRLAQIGGIAHDVSLHQALCVYVVDPDPRSRDERAASLRRAGHQVTTFASEAAFLHVAAALASGCVFVRTDDAAPAPFALAAALRTRRIDLRLVFETTLDGDVALAISAMKSGAADVLPAPAAPEAVLAAVASALADVREEDLADHAGQVARSQIALMSQREREVLAGLLNGGTNKTIARTLGISPRTVEIHRARVMERLGAQTVPEAVMAAAAAGMRPLRSQREDR
jgi:PAS domain S-box-containing protein